MYKYLLSLVVLLPLSTSLLAQDSDETEKVEEVEEIVTTGIKSSLISAIDIKRNNVGVMEAITAEDFGKFPDGNLAESLARVSGVGIDRSNLEGEGVAVRAGHHCTQPLMDACRLVSTTRASVGAYSANQDFDKLAKSLAKVKKIFGV